MTDSSIISLALRTTSTLRWLSALVALVAATGCASVNICREGGHTMVDIVNTGWYFLNFIPLASGDPANPNRCRCRLFVPTVTLENNMMMLNKTIGDEGAGMVRHLTSYTTEEAVLFILFKRRAYHTSAELVPKEDVCESPNP